MRVRPGDTMLTLVVCILISSVQAYSTELRNFKITRIIVPDHVSVNQKEADIICEYDANFTVMSWFKGPKEFFRYKPMHVPSTVTFAASGVGQIEHVTCGQEKCHLRLSALTPEATGLYRCDIEREEPPFRYQTRSSYMQVEGHEPRKPLLTGVAEKYTEGDIIRAFCRGDRDTELRWYINGEELLKNRGSPVLQHQSSRNLFLGLNYSSIVIQCAEVKYGKLIGSNEMRAYWREPVNPMKNGTIKIANFVLFLVLIPIIVLSVSNNNNM